MKDIKKILGKRIKELRKYKGLSQEQLAEYANVDQRNLSHIECGDNFPSKSLLDIAKALEIDLPTLFDFEHLTLNRENMSNYIISNIQQLNDKDITTVYRLVKSLR
ncbi:helix-turn-helix transcriptional regulator [bacterium]|nr:helix-turn-helix transcriptional regulator [bacterium]